MPYVLCVCVWVCVCVCVCVYVGVRAEQGREILSEDGVVFNSVQGNPIVFSGHAVFPADQKFDPSSSPWVTNSVAQNLFGRDDWFCWRSCHVGWAVARQLVGGWYVRAKQADVEGQADVPVSREEEVGGDGCDHMAGAKWPAISGAEFRGDGQVEVLGFE
ncbi:unnamed protein product [Closterium sp. NIES-53]